MDNVKSTERIRFSDNVQEAINDWYQAEVAAAVVRAAWQKAFAEGRAACGEDGRFCVSDPRAEAGRNAACHLLQPMKKAAALSMAHACWISKLTGVPFVMLEHPKR